jgi:molybdenum cofactor synthesis domain-containing protein
VSLDVTLIVVSDRAASGERADETAALLGPELERAGFVLARVEVVPDERARIAAALAAAAARTPVVLTTGGTGVGPRDVTPEATRDVLDLEIPGLAEVMRRRSLESTIHAVGSRAVAGAVGRALVLNLPGRPRGAVECFAAVAPALPHLVAVRRGPVDDASHGAPGA